MDGPLNVAAGIITYNPDLDRLKLNIDSISGQVSEVFIYDNGSRNCYEISQLVRQYPNISVIKSEVNLGIACGLNNVCYCAAQNHYQWILTLDQDSVCPENLITNLGKYVDDSIGIISPRIVYKGFEKDSYHSENDREFVPWVITSGSLTNLKGWNEIDGFDEEMFIDKVDTDFGIRLGFAGFKTLRVNTVVLEHELGNLRCKKLLGKTIYVTNHSPFRIFYQARNTIYLWKKTKYGSPAFEEMKLLIKIIFFERQKTKKLVQFVSGVKSGIKKTSFKSKGMTNEK